ncbi:MAG TPA: hypothetical protein VM262_10795, partial [Acidimicrobiales bacterium]|nr:hypothetical protein [Acidimicrobiales bacterium]
GGSEGRGWDQGVARLLDDARNESLAQARARERWLQRQAAEGATFVGALLDLAESGVGVRVTLQGGRRHDGQIAGLGPDVAVLIDRGEHVVVHLAGTVSVRPHPAAAAAIASGDRPAALDLTFGEVLGRMAAEEPEAALSLISGEVVGGSLVSVGRDVVSVRVAPGAGGVVYCPLRSVASVRLRSG